MWRAFFTMWGPFSLVHSYRFVFVYTQQYKEYIPHILVYSIAMFTAIYTYIIPTTIYFGLSYHKFLFTLIRDNTILTVINLNYIHGLFIYIYIYIYIYQTSTHIFPYIYIYIIALSILPHPPKKIQSDSSPLTNAYDVCKQYSWNRLCSSLSAVAHIFNTPVFYVNMFLFCVLLFSYLYTALCT